MRLSDLRPAKGANKRIKRRGCGTASGHGKTSCRGHKGSGARSGTKRRFGFEGGQMPLMRRVPKRGFNSKFPKEYQIVNLGQLKGFKDADSVTPEILRQKDIIKISGAPVKILADGEIKKALTVSAHKFSKKAAEKIQAAGGKVELIKESAVVTSAS